MVPIADNVPITAGSGTPIAADDISSVWYQRVKLVDGTADSTTVIPGDGSGLHVRPSPFTTRLTTTSSGLTTATTAYSANDQLGAQVSFSSAVRASGGSGVVRGVRLLDKADITTLVDVMFFRASVTPASDNAAATFSDSDMDSFIGAVAMSMVDWGANRAAQVACYLPFDCSATTLYACMVTRTAHTFFGAATDLALALYVAQD